MPAPIWTGGSTSISDYTDYAEAYDALYTRRSAASPTISISRTMPGTRSNPPQHIIGSDHFSKMSQELRVASPADKPFRVIAGAFYQRQTNHIHQDYQVAGLAPRLVGQRLPGHACG